MIHPDGIHLLFFLTVALAFMFAFSNGLINGGGLASVVIATRAMEPFFVLLVVASCEILGLLFLGNAVIHTLARDFMVFPVLITPWERLWILVAALGGASSWNFGMGRMGLPSSSTHALVGGLAGASVARFGFQSLHWSVFLRIFLFLGLVPASGALLSFLLTRGVHQAGGHLTPAAGRWLDRFQVGALAGAALGHGSNDGQKSVAMILLALPALTGSAVNHVPFGLWLASGVCLAAGAFLGSKRTVQKVGQGFYRLRSIEGTCAEGSTMFLIGISSWAGYPMSTSHVISSSILGAGVATHPRSVRWTPVSEMVAGWLLTIPVAAMTAAFLLKCLEWCHVVS